MQFPESWLRSFCNPDLNTQALADLLTMAGMEVEALDPVAPPFNGVVVGEIVSAEPHPNADRLRVCRVDAGAHSPEGPLQIVCGAPNARVGLKVPLATVGALLPPGEDGKPFAIKLGKLRGVESHGMLCSSKELQISGEGAGLLELAADAPVGTDLRQWLNLDDTLFTLKLTPNLGHALSVFGIAREVAALTGASLLAPAITPVVPTNDARVPVVIEAPDLCGRFSGRVVRDLNAAAKTPAWMVERLERCGQRPVNALVDISNYVMFELGRPTHIFDLDHLHGGLVVRWGRAGEQLKLLNGHTITVDGQVGVIADSQAVESLAGIMGGDATAVSDATRHVYVEAAFWWPEAVAGRSRRFNFSTDAGHRFERGVDPALTVEHIERITALILQICGGEAGPIDDQITSLPARPPVRLRIARASKVIGRTLTRTECAGVMSRLGLAFTEETDSLVVTPPSWRFDLTIEEDLIEEVARVLGYENLPQRPPVAPVVGAGAPRSAVQPPRAAPSPGRAGLPGDHQLQLRRSALGAGAGRQCRSHPAAQPDRRAAVGDALQPDGQPGAGLAQQPRSAHRTRAGLRAGAVSSSGMRRRWRETPRSLACDSRCTSPAWRGARPPRCSGAWPSAPWTSMTSRATSRPCSPRGWLGSCPVSIQPCIPDAARPSRWTDIPSAWWVNCIRAGDKPTNCRRHRCCSSWRLGLCSSTRCLSSRPCRATLA